MDYFLEIKNFFSKDKILIIVLLFFLCFQFFFSFLFPSVGSTDNWLPIEKYVLKYSPDSLDNFLLAKIVPLLSSYKINSDVGPYLEVAQNFSPEAFTQNRNIINRPLYPLLIFLLSLPLRLFIEPSYGILFGLAILINFIFIAGTLILLFFILKKFFSQKIAFFSTFLLIFSPFVHSYGVQVLPEMITAFFVMLSFYFLKNYIDSPSIKKLVVFSFILGIFILNKMFFAIPLFILLLSAFFKRIKEGAIFVLIFIIPFLFWYFWVKNIWQINYFVNEIQNWNMGVWIFNIFNWPWQKTAQILLGAIPEFVSTFCYSFLLVPVLLAILGIKNLFPKIKTLFYLFVFSVFTLGFLVGFYYRHTFMFFPFIYPISLLGIERISQKIKPPFSFFVFGLIIFITLFISELNIYQFFSYDF